MKEFIKKNLNLLIFLVPLCFYTIGFFIHNNYLSKFNVANYELIKGKYIFAGFVYTLILITVGFFYNVHISFSNPRDNFKKDNLFLWFFRFECILLIFFLIFPGKDEPELITTDLTIFGLIKIPERFTLFFPAYITFILIMWFFLSIAFRGEFPEKREKRRIVYEALILFIPTNFVVIWGLLFNKLFLNIFIFLGLYFFCTVAFTLGSAHHQELPYLKSRFFQEKFSTSQRRIEEYIFLLLFTVPFIIALTSMYSKNIYNKLPSNFGGAKPISVRIKYIDSNGIKGDLIDETVNSVTIKFQEEDKVLVINKSSIKEIEILK